MNYLGALVNDTYNVLVLNLLERRALSEKLLLLGGVGREMGSSTLSATGLSDHRSTAWYTSAIPPRAIRWPTSKWPLKITPVSQGAAEKSSVILTIVRAAPGKRPKAKLAVPAPADATYRFPGFWGTMDR